MSPVHRILVPSALSLGLLALPAAAHPTMCGSGPGDPASNIVVQGEGRASIAPDLATVSLGVTTQAPTAAQAMADNASRQTAIVQALRAQGVAPADLQTQGLNLSPIQDFSREGQPPVITGYQAQNIVTARIRDLARLGPMLDAMVAAGATDVQGISFSREDARATQDEARTQAVAEARHRAEVIARAAGVELGPLVSLTDMSMAEGPRPLAMMAKAADSEAATPIEAGELTLTAQVTGVWSLVQAGGPAGGCGPEGGFHGGPDHHHGMMHDMPGMPEDGPGMMPHPQGGMGMEPGGMMDRGAPANAAPPPAAPGTEDRGPAPAAPAAPPPAPSGGAAAPEGGPAGGTTAPEGSGQGTGGATAPSN